MTDIPRRLTLYPHGNYREWSSKQYDDWKVDLAEEYVHVSAFNDLKAWADKLAESLVAMVDSYDNMPGLGATEVLYQYGRALAAIAPESSPPAAPAARDDPAASHGEQ